jgi:hypothetical protein
MPLPPKTVAINPVTEAGEEAENNVQVNFPTLPAAGHGK